MRAADAGHSPVRRELRGPLAALAFLTRVPIGRAIALDAPDLARGVVAFPVVGAGIGLATGAAGAALAGPLPAAIAGVLALTVAVLLSGALHLDGLGDTADALGGTSREAALAIMRDSRAGSYAVAAIGLALLVQATALATLAAGGRVTDVAAAFALARAVAPAVAAFVPYARAGDGLGRALTSRGRALLAAAVALALVVALEPRHTAALVGCAVACGLAGAVFCRQRFGGVTGDTLGAAIAVTETACLVVTCIR